MKLDFDLSHT